MSEQGKKLTKKEKKAQAFRQQKGKSTKTTTAQPFTDEDAVPISEDINQAESEREPVVDKEKEKGKKRKRETEEGEEEKVAGEGEEEVPKKKKRQRGKKKSQQVRPGVDEEGKPRLIVFVGTSL